MSISAADVKKLRDATSAGMMECKKALEEAEGDFDKAVEILRISGAAKAAKRGAERETSAGLVAADGAALVELLCETDFVAKSSEFLALASEIAALVKDAKNADHDAVLGLTLANGATVGAEIENRAGVIGEKLELGRVALHDGDVALYLHRRSSDLPPAVGVMVQYSGDEEVARSIAMQIAAMRPTYLTREEVPDSVVENEKRIVAETAKEEGKPEAAMPKIIEGRVNGFFKENVLLEQSSVTDNKKSVKQILDESGTTITGFTRFEIGAA
ncbi:MAG: elongation factor Ts [Actinobacteria bacterium]|nr:elongation factor Ts [Actinomycetota bacterium]